MADESQYSTGVDTATNKRKYEEETGPTPSIGTRRPTGFSSGPIPSVSPDPALPLSPPPPQPQPQPQPSYKISPSPMDEIQIAKQKAQEIAARLLSGADPKRPRFENGASFNSGDKGFSSGPSDGKPISGLAPSTIPVSYGGFQSSTSKKIEIPNMRVGLVIGKAGDTIKYLQLQSGAKIQVTRDMDADPNSPTRMIELMGTPEQIARAEQLINEVLQEAEAGGSAVASRRITGHAGSEQFVTKIPNNKVGLVIGKGGETIKSMQAKSGARIQVIPLHLPPGDTSTERTLQIDGASEQIEHAKQLVNEVISGENRLRNQSMGGYSQQGYQARPPTSWAQPGTPPMQQSGYGYMQPGAYAGPTPQYSMPQAPYGGYQSQQTSGGYPSSYDQSSMPPSQQTALRSGYDYYGQQQQQTPDSSATPTDATCYSYYQHASGYNQQGQGYPQDGYGGYGTHPQSGYVQPPYDQQQGYNSSAGYGNANNPSQEGDSSTQAPPPAAAQSGQTGYGTGQQPRPNTAGYPPQGATTHPGYGAPPPSQPGFGQSGYGSGRGAPTTQKPPVYGQTQQSPSTPGSYSQPGYPHSQSPVSGPPSSGYGAVPGQQPGHGAPPPYGGGPAPSDQHGYGQAPPPYSSYGGYAQPVSGDSSSDGSAPASQNAQQPGVTEASPKS